MKILRAVGNLLDGAEAGIIVLFGTALCLALAVGVPAFLIWTLFQEGRVLIGSLMVALLALAALGAYRDLSARRWTWLSAGLAALP